MKSAAYTEKIKQMMEEIKKRNFERRKEFFWSRVDVKSIEECWPWKGGKTRGGDDRRAILGVR